VIKEYFDRERSKAAVIEVEKVAKVLKTTPAWLAFGSGRDEVEEIVYDSKTDSFERKGSWALDEAWLRERYEVAPAEISLAVVTDYSPSLVPGDVAIVKRGAEPSVASGGEFVYGHQDELHVAWMNRAARGGPYRIYDKDMKSFSELEPKDVNILGRVIGKVTSAGETRRSR